MTIPKAHITWTATTLGASFQAYYVQRQHPAGWFDIAHITSEATVAFDDYEARYGVSESYRVQVQDILGIRSAASSPQSITLSASTYNFVSNESPAVNAELDPLYPLQATLPERLMVAPVVGRYGQRLSRSTDNLGEVLDLHHVLTGASGPALWRTLVTNLRAALSYICVLDPWGNRWFAGLAPSGVSLEFSSFGELDARLVEVTDTPSIVVV